MGAGFFICFYGNKFSLKPFTHLHGFLQRQKLVVLSMFPKKRYTQFRFIKRLSPFLPTALFLPVLFIYGLVAGEGISKWLLCSLFVVSEINLFYIDVVLWKYFEGKKIFRIWREMFLVLVAAYFVA